MIESLIGEGCRTLLDHFFDGVYIVDRDRIIVFWNRSAEKITGYSRDEVVGKCCADNILRHVTPDGDPLCRTGCPLKGTIEDGVPRAAEVYLHHKAGHRVPVQVRANPVIDAAGAIHGAVEIFTDDSRHEAVFRQLKDMERSLYQDALTGIGNRKFADIRMSELMGAYRDHAQASECSSSTSTASSPSTTPTGTPSGTRSSPWWPGPCRTACAPRTGSAGSAGRNSCACCPMWPRRPLAGRRTGAHARGEGLAGHRRRGVACDHIRRRDPCLPVGQCRLPHPAGRHDMYAAKQAGRNRVIVSEN